VARAEAWRWCSLWRRHTGAEHRRALLHPWPLPLPRDWVERVNRPETQAELEAVRRSVVRRRPFGSVAWERPMAARLGLAYTLRPRGRPKKAPEGSDAPPSKWSASPFAFLH
jgi:putative transposase